MTPPDRDPAQRALESAAGELRERHALSRRRPQPLPARRQLAALPEWLQQARVRLREPEPALSKAAEWLLDNDYLVLRARRQIDEDLTPGFYARLPALAGGEDAGLPRSFAIAHGLLAASHMQLSLTGALHFTRAYQQSGDWLSIAELWALPALLRLACVELLVGALGRLLPELEAPFALSPPASRPSALEDTECVARALANLAVLSAIPWKDFFERASRVEELLQRDPAGVYPQMDFGTRDHYRKAVEGLAQHSAQTEPEVAARAVAHAGDASAAGLPEAHVGHWLVGEGRPAFEAALGWRIPWRTALRRRAARRVGGLYGAALVASTAAAAAFPALLLASSGASAQLLLAGVALALIPASAVGITLVHWIATRLVPPRVLPKLDFERGIPAEFKTAVVVPVLVASPSEARELLERLELHFLANPDPGLEFALLSDLPDGPRERLPEDEAVERALAEGIRRLNARAGDEGRGPFHLLHRSRRLNPAEGVWMGWERKRGKLEEFNRLVAGEDAPDFSLREGDSARLRDVRFAITLDADTRLPPGSAARLAGTLAHPLNRAKFDAPTRRIRSGYSVLQPRVAVSPEDGRRSLFSRLYAGDTAIDIYSSAASDVYQDLFGTGIFVGKGIYDVAAFRRSLAGRVPENALVSHDLFEGVHGRVALAGDVVLYEDFPGRYEEFLRRWQRWVRGDWQLLPWLLPRVPGPGAQRLANPLGALDRWKIADNLRRSLVPPALLALLVGGWLVLPGEPWLWTGFAVAAPAAHLLADLGAGLARAARRGALRRSLRDLEDQAGRWLLALVFLVQDAATALDAILRTLWRVCVSRRQLLQWTSAAHVAAHFEARESRSQAWRRLRSGPLVAAPLAALVAWLRPAALPSAAPLLLLWLASPEIALRIARPRTRSRAALDPDSRDFLRRIARRTWHFFETFAGPEDHWLPPDNYQEHPRGVIAHRTSPTNIGMLLVSALTAADLGHVGLRELAARLRSCFDTLLRLERHRGHFFNWYDTRSLAPLEPRYVSTVDSGNLAVCLVTLEQGCRELAAGPALRPEAWDGLRDLVALLGAALRALPAGDGASQLRAAVAAIADQIESARGDPGRWPQVLAHLCADDCRELDRLLARVLDLPGAGPEALREIRAWLERTHHQLRGMQRDLERLAPWALPLAQAPAGDRELARELERLLPPAVPMDQLAGRSGAARKLLVGSAAEAGLAPEQRRWREAMDRALEAGDAAARELRGELLELAARAQDIAYGMDFRPLYDSEIRRFRIGHNASADRPDPHHYDLLATEARLASFFAIAKRDVPVEHWFHLGRSVVRTPAGLALVSWGGSMFEYLMPPLFLRSHPGTLLAESEESAAAAQRRHARSLGIPWGISESGFASLDPGGNYRYQSFGVPGLGLRRGLSRDRVIAPYASALALPLLPRAVTGNLRELARLGLCGLCGFYEAADFTPERQANEGSQAFTPVRSWMAHHQGMLLAALGNALCGDAHVRRFHADRRVCAADLLLHERVPREVEPETGRDAESEARRPETAPPALAPWQPAGPERTPRVHALGNGRLASWISERGAGALRWQDRALTRWLPDATREDQGLWIYLRDAESGEIWSAGRQPTGVPADESSVVFHPHLAEFHRRDHGIALRMEVSIAPADDLEIRRLSVTNESDRPRVLSITSYAEVVLAPPLDDERHPAFSKLFVESEWIEELRAQLFTRRPRHPGEHPPVLLHRLVCDAPDGPVRCESDRRAFLGRHGDPRRPRGVERGLTGTLGFTLDPILALELRIALEPAERRELSFVTSVAGSRESALELAERYATASALDWILADAARESAREAHALGLEAARLPELQRLASALLDPHSGLRSAPAPSGENPLGQSRLWGLGLSGDDPILVLRAGDPRQSELLPVLVRGHELWRRRGLRSDLVVLRTGASGYAEAVRERFFEVLREAGLHGALGQRAGIHLIFADQIRHEETRLLESVARVVLDDTRGPLAQQLAAADPWRVEIPLFQPSRPELAAQAEEALLPRSAALRFDNGFGGFAPDGREYAIELEPGATTPAAWCNVLANDGFGCLTSEAGLGASWAENAGENRLTPWSNDPLLDPPAEVLYLRDEESGEVWTPTPLPCGPRSACEVRHGAGYTRWRRRSHELEQELLAFVPPDDPVQLLRLRLRNLAGRSRRVTVTCYVEWLLGALRSVARPHVQSEWDPEACCFLAQNPWNPDFAERVAFLTSTEAPHGLTADRGEFLGRGGDLRQPAALLRWGLSGRVETGADPCAAYQVHVDLAAGAEIELGFALGQGRDRSHAQELARSFRRPERIARAWEELAPFWDAWLGALQVATPDPAFDLMANRWLLYQTLASRVLARAGFHQASGAIGFRDQLQDVLALLHADPVRVRAHILLCAAHQFEEGDVLHWWHPPSDRGVRTRCSDDLLWLPFATCHYVEATGDLSILDEAVAFLRAPPLEPEEETRYSRFEPTPLRRSLFEHCERALERGVTRGPHGLPKIGSGDWNDGMDRLGQRGNGESVWLAWFAIAAMRRFAALCTRRGREDLALRWQRGASELAQTVEAVAWDGDWYLRAFDDDGRPYGSKSCDEGRIDSIAQSWALLSGAGDAERAAHALAAAERELVRADERVIRLLWPPFDQTPRDPGYIKAYPPGVRENGGQYSHAAAWLGHAFAARGDAEQAARIFSLLNPISHSGTRADALHYRSEPYVLAADVASLPPQRGRGGWTWYTGSAAWTWRLAVEGILGLRLREGRLAIEPCLPPEWKGYEARLRGPAGALAIRVEVTPALAPGEREISLEGVRCGEGGVAFPSDGTMRRVQVRLGARASAGAAEAP